MFEGLPAAAFAFFAELATHNDRQWFAAHTDLYRSLVDEPWRRLIESVAVPLAERLPGVDAAVKTGRVLSRVNQQWPRAGAHYRTGLRATFAGLGRKPEGGVFVALDASGVRAGVEVQAGSEAWWRVAAQLEAHGWPAVAEDLRWWLAGEAWSVGEAARLAEAMRSRRRGSLRLASVWVADEAVAAGPTLAERIWSALVGALPLYVWGWDESGAEVAHGDAVASPSGLSGAAVRETTLPAEAGDAEGQETARAGDGTGDTGETGAAVDEGPSDGYNPPAGRAPGAEHLPRLPRALGRALARRAADEGVTVEAFILYALTVAAAG